MPTGLFDEFVRSGLSKDVAMHESMWTTVGWSASDEAHRFAIELELASGNSETRTLEPNTYVHVFTPQLAYADGNSDEPHLLHQADKFFMSDTGMRIPKVFSQS